MSNGESMVDNSSGESADDSVDDEGADEEDEEFRRVVASKIESAVDASNFANEGYDKSDMNLDLKSAAKAPNQS